MRYRSGRRGARQCSTRATTWRGRRLCIGRGDLVLLKEYERPETLIELTSLNEGSRWNGMGGVFGGKAEQVRIDEEAEDGRGGRRGRSTHSQ